MPRPKGSKNKPKEQELEEKKEEILEMTKEDIELLGHPKEEKRIFLGYHPITGEEVWHLKQ